MDVIEGKREISRESVQYVEISGRQLKGLIDSKQSNDRGGCRRREKGREREHIGAVRLDVWRVHRRKRIGEYLGLTVPV